MKSFGVRLAAGAVTILFGCYAAALAQKDRQDDSDSWTAETPSLSEPAAPIGEFGEKGDPSWLTQPPTELADSALSQPDTDPVDQPAGSVQLVQHTEPMVDDQKNMPAFSAELPASLGAEADPRQAVSDDSETPQAQWLMPDPSATPDPSAISGSSDSAPNMSMSFPGADSLDGDSASEIGLAADGTFDPTAAESAAAQQSALADNAAPAIVAGGAAIGMASAAASDPPTNLLRGSPDGTNALRGDASQGTEDGSQSAYQADSPATAGIFADSPGVGSPSAVGAGATGIAASGPSAVQHDPAQFEAANVPQAGLAQDAPSFGASAQQFDQPGSMPGVSTAGLGAPQAGPSAAGDAYSQPMPNNGPDRTASLSRDGQPSVDGMPNSYQPAAMAQPSNAIAIEQAMTLDTPGERRLEGAQTPSVIIQKRAPAEVKVGKPASFVVHVQNVGAVDALNVAVHDRVPAGMRLVDASPTPIQQGNLLMWEIGSMPAGDERTITVQLMPEQEGELGSVARVSFEAAASVRTISTRPELKIVQRVPEQGVLIGQQLEIELEVSNPGSGAATGVVLQENVPEGLDHPQGRQLDNLLGTLEPGEVRNQVLRLRAVKPGVIQNTIRLLGDDGLTAEHTVTVQVVAPELQIELKGPSKRFLERQASYELNLANNGTADATNVEISVQLDRGLTFVSTDKQGQYDPGRHAVFWSVASIPAGASGSVPLTLLPVEAGEQAIKMEARADLGVIANSERMMSVEGFAELSFAISNAGGPIEVGAETNYEIHVTNSGSMADTNVRVQLQLPEGLELVSADGEAGHDGRGMVAFQPKSQLAPGEDLKYSLRVRGLAPGTHVVRAVVISDHSTVPVTKEESTRVYADR